MMDVLFLLFAIVCAAIVCGCFLIVGGYAFSHVTGSSNYPFGRWLHRGGEKDEI